MTPDKKEIVGFPEGFRRLKLLDRGGMANLYKAVHLDSGRTVALKVLREDYLKDETIRQRFIQEAKLTQEQEHTNIIEVVDSGRWKTYLYIAFEYIQGGNLRDHLLEGRYCSLRQVIACIDGVAAGLATIHRVGIIHRDLKPENILVRDDGVPVITDFGVAKDTESIRIVSIDGIILGTPDYMAPEQMRGQRVDYRCDLFSLGVIFFEMLTGQLPFLGDTLADLIRQHIHDELRLASDVNPAVPPSLDTIVAGLLETEPDKRIRDATQVRSELADFVRGLPENDIALYADHENGHIVSQVTTARRMVRRGKAGSRTTYPQGANLGLRYFILLSLTLLVCLVFVLLW